ncbi:hypothetical protein BCR44DRAFT_115991 [Catenaria anguillulae PL171]|uniref:Pentatricopeptide repeat-containing protein n=1 Tax=Catenaria anguillulae PL171 TaxID=765915 RepID=A0A1Y2HEL6_9FUNG|nr:hypothetical protein BCR44DRAFT_115991 [Catenaria anguillulae PL171]
MEKLLAFANRLNVKSSPKWTRALVALRIKAYGFANRHADGFRIWDEALAEGIVPDSSTQSLILDSCGFVKSKARLVAIMDLLIREQWGGTDVNIWTSAVEAFCRMGDLESALNVVHKILPLKGLEPDAKMVGTLITVEPRLNRPLKDKRVWELVDRVGGQEVFSAGVRFDEPRPV